MNNIVNVEDENLRPQCSTKSSIGYDLKSSGYYHISPGETMVIPTGVSLNIPQIDDDYVAYAEITGRSGLSAKGILVHTGTIDADYTGELKVCITNLSGLDFRINEYDRIAQLKFLEGRKIIGDDNLIQLDEVRGENGFGSTGQ